MSKLEQKVALITGGSRGIGAGIAKRFAKEGATVAITYASSGQKAAELVRTIEAEGGKAIAIKADSANAEAVKSAIAQTVENFGHIDILVNNAGVANFKPLDEYTLEDFNQTFSVNVQAVFVASQEVVKNMPAGGRIITIGSAVADIVFGSNMTLYALSKTALTGLTKGLARDLGDRNITVNLVQPGPVKTDMMPADESFQDVMRGHMAIKQFGEAEDIASLVTWVASDEARYVTGESINIDGGISI
jgi:3-oxoacyl-[acyl-carrier protein] reductase